MVVLYDRDEQYYLKVVSYLASGLNSGVAVIVAVTPDHATGLCDRLAAHGIDVPAVRRTGQLTILDAIAISAAVATAVGADRQCFLEQVGAPVLRAAAAYPRLIALGEIVDVLAAAGRVEAVLQVERYWNELLEGRPASLWCAYQIRNFARAGASNAFMDVCALHGDASPLDDPFLEGASRRMVVARLQQQMSALHAEIEERRAIERRLRQHHLLTAGLAEALTTTDIAEVAIREIGDLVGASGAAVYARTGAQPIATRGTLVERADVLAEVRDGRPVWRDDVVAQPRSFEARPYAAIVLELDAGGLDDDTREFVSTIARQVGQALERARLFEVERDARRRLDEFLAMLGHELRNPLAPILSAVEVMRARGESASERERAVIERQTRHLSRMVDDLLDLSRVTRGQVQLRRAPHTVSSFLGKALEMAAPFVERRNHRVEIDVPRELPAVDVDRMAQVAGNLLLNAAKYTPEGGHIWVRAARVDERVVLSVCDDGEGIPDDLLPRMFDPFVQGEQALDRAAGGLGIGLTLVKSLVELHGGTVEARSEGPGRGAELRVALPIAVMAGDHARARPRDATCPELRVLVVDDNTDGAEMLRDALELLGHGVAVVNDGPRALAECVTFEPDVILLDIGLPLMDGFEVARRLREQGSRARLVALTGYGQHDDKERTRAAGFDLHLVKPIDLAALDAALQKMSR